MDQVLRIAMQAGWPLAIVGAVGATVAYVIAQQFGKSREEVREMRVAAEHGPKPEHIRKFVSMWPDLSQFPATVQQGEMVNRANREEGRLAQRKEAVLGYTRILVFVAVVGIALIIGGQFYKP